MLGKVPFGRTNSLGIIFGIPQTDTSQLSFQVKEILSVEYGDALFGSDLPKLILWMHKYYAASYKSLLEAMKPIAIRGKVASKVTTKVFLKRYYAVKSVKFYKTIIPNNMPYLNFCWRLIGQLISRN
jgi:primosomal protein N'